MSMTHDTIQDAPGGSQPAAASNRPKLAPWELGALGLAFCLIVFGTIPNFFGALSELRGEECSRRLTLAGNCLKHLAIQNQTEPGGKICEVFDLNQLLERVQRGGSYLGGSGTTVVYYKINVEPDCADAGDHSVSLILGDDGEIVPPSCSMADDDFAARGLHVCDMSQVTGDLGLE